MDLKGEQLWFGFRLTMPKLIAQWGRVGSSINSMLDAGSSLASMQSNPSILKGRVGAFLPILAALAPALVLLAAMVPLRVPVPYLDQWSFVAQYEDWVAGNFGWSNLFAKEGDHPAAVGRIIYFAVLQWMRGNVAVLPLLNWLLSAVVAWCVWLFVRRGWSDDRVAQGLLMFIASLTIFNAAQGGVWIWDCTYQSYLPGSCLAFGLVLLSKSELSWWRLGLAAFLSVIATFSYAAGFLVGFLLVLPIWHNLRSSRLLVAGVWLTFHGLVALLMLKGFGQAKYFHETPVSIALLIEHPLIRLQFVMVLLGQMLGKGLIFEPLTVSLALGSLLFALFCACVIVLFCRRGNRELLTNSLPWVVFGCYGILHSVLVSIGRLHDSLTNKDALAERVMAERFIVFSLFSVLGTVLLVATIIRHGDLGEMQRRWITKLSGPLLTLIIVAAAVNWEAGYQLMKMENRLMKQDRAMLSFGSLIKADPDRLWNRKLKFNTVPYAKLLSSMGRLPGVKFVHDQRLKSIQPRKPAKAKGAQFNKPVLLPNGAWELSGLCPCSRAHSVDLPDLIIITSQLADDGVADELILAVATPVLPETFFERESQRRRYPQHFFGWRQTIDSSSLPSGKVVLRAYTFDHDAQRLELIDGAQPLDLTTGPLISKGT
jgi:hypothetical protein